MAEFPSSSECVLLHKADSMGVFIHPTMLAEGWLGGTGIKWVQSPTGELMVERSDGRFSGILLWGSDEKRDEHTSMQGQQKHYGYGVAIWGGSMIATVAFEKYTWSSRNAGLLVPITYHVGDVLYFSLRGLWTNEDEANLSGAGYTISQAGRLVQVPTSQNRDHMTIQLTI